ncbi:Rnf-Nqr domain containing protein [Acetanaerobacterium elongatum]|uniref:Electron transport complex protein RnfE n=1 Tax=Acetanaerobacterium elongatum TaxID=258515 RepID=A0A1G9XZZ3_9FIRM|nr:Rnf-Nqr domain containing protein [Acetanaerobacterium elongatum]SDN01733.1 electron transport complex protein RnfE [Acetanaerobacterium elongatum]
MAKKRKNRFLMKVREFWSANPVLVNGLTLAPVAVAAIYLKNAVALSLTLAVITIPTLLVASLIRQRLPLAHRIPIYAVISAICYAGATALIKLWLPETVETVGIYLPLMITNTIVVMRAEAFGVRNKTRWVLLDALVQVLGYAFVICTVGLVREYIGNATLWGNPVDNALPITGIALPFGGLILLGLFAALYQYINNHAAQRRLNAHITVSTGDDEPAAAQTMEVTG